MPCIQCGKEQTEYSFHALQVQTLHVRDLKGESRVQALGGFEDRAVCEGCAHSYLDSVLDLKKTAAKKLLPFAAALILGPVIAAVFRSDGAFRLLGIAMAVCGLLGIAGTLSEARKKQKAFAALDPEDALYQAAWEVFLKNAPAKNGDNDLTYIPVDEKTLARKNGDLMILYDLLPEIAVQAWDRLHGINTEGRNG